jgi:hypothetical protein
MAASSFHGSLSAEEARRILGFLGYGRLSAPVWFIGLEEGLSEQNSVDRDHNLRARATWDEVMDLDRAHLLLHEGGAPMRVSVKPPRTPTWRWMAKICRALAGNSAWRDNQTAEEYVKRRLGRTDPAIGETFLTELSPIPSKKAAENKKWLSFFQRAITDCDRLIWQRSIRLSAMIEENRPKLIFCYGSEKPENSAKFKSFFSDRSWQRVEEKSELSRHEHSVRVLMPFFGNGRISHDECQRVISSVVGYRS